LTTRGEREFNTQAPMSGGVRMLPDDDGAARRRVATVA
jgi:hypothetical protein